MVQLHKRPPIWLHWRNWQTRRTQNPLLYGYRFKSYMEHQFKYQYFLILKFCSGSPTAEAMRLGRIQCQFESDSEYQFGQQYNLGLLKFQSSYLKCSHVVRQNFCGAQIAGINMYGRSTLEDAQEVLCKSTWPTNLEECRNWQSDSPGKRVV